MKTLLCTEPRRFEFVDRENPKIEKSKAILKIKRVGICGTDLHAFEGTQPYFNYPRVLGHELAGELVERGDATHFSLGDKVTCIPYFNCGNCIACRSYKPNCCVNLQVCGVHIDGGMTEYLSVPSYSLLAGDDLSYDELALIEPLAIGAHGVRRANISAGENVLVIGAGPIGLGTMEFAKLAGAKVIALDVNEKRLQFCKETLNVSHTLDASLSNVDQRLREITNGEMPTVVIDATGNLKAINTAFQYMAHGARYVLIGLQKGEISFSHPEFHKREGTLMSSRNATREDFESVKQVLRSGAIRPEAYITHRVNFPEVIHHFETWLNPESGVIKAMVEVG